MSAGLYKQCSMIRKDGNTTLRRVEWIPMKYAVVGKVLKLKFNDGWIDGWVVETANGEAQEPPDNFSVTLPSLDVKTLTKRKR